MNGEELAAMVGSNRPEIRTGPRNKPTRLLVAVDNFLRGYTFAPKDGGSLVTAQTLVEELAPVIIGEHLRALATKYRRMARGEGLLTPQFTGQWAANAELLDYLADTADPHGGHQLVTGPDPTHITTTKEASA